MCAAEFQLSWAAGGKGARQIAVKIMWKIIEPILFFVGNEKPHAHRLLHYNNGVLLAPAAEAYNSEKELPSLWRQKGQPTRTLVCALEQKGGLRVSWSQSPATNNSSLWRRRNYKTELR